MELKDYFEMKEIKVKEFAALVGCPMNAIYCYLKGQKVKEYDRAKKIEKLTNGQVTVEDLML